MGPGILPETTVGKHNPPCHLQMPLKLYHARRKPYVNMVQKCRRVLWAKAHLKWTVSKWKSVLWSDESKFDFLVGNHGHRVLRAKEEGDLPACYQHSVQKPASLMVWRCISAYLCSSWQAELSKSSRTRTTLVTVFSLCCHLVSASVAWWQKLRDSGGVSSHRPSGS